MIGRQKAFTLIEILVALVIFAVIALISYRTLSSVFSVRETLQRDSGRLRDVALLFARVESDISGLLDRPAVNADGLQAKALELVPVGQNADGATLAFSRTGFADSDGMAGPPLRTGYRLREGKIEWLLWPGLDQAPRAAPAAYLALDAVREATWQAVDADGTEHAAWPLPGHEKDSPFPAALQLRLTLASGEELTRLFALRHD